MSGLTSQREILYVFVLSKNDQWRAIKKEGTVKSFNEKPSCATPPGPRLNRLRSVATIGNLLNYCVAYLTT